MAKPEHEYFRLSRSATWMRRFELGTDTTPNGVQVHDFFEEVYILDGAITDLHLDQTFTAGM